MTPVFADLSYLISVYHPTLICLESTSFVSFFSNKLLPSNKARSGDSLEILSVYISAQATGSGKSEKDRYRSRILATPCDTVSSHELDRSYITPLFVSLEPYAHYQLCPAAQVSERAIERHQTVIGNLIIYLGTSATILPLVTEPPPPRIPNHIHVGVRASYAPYPRPL